MTLIDDKFIGHTHQNGNGKPQLLKDHLLNTQRFAEDYASDLNLSKAAGLTGLLHDLGKIKGDFQEYILDPKNNTKIDHSGLGGAFIKSYVDDYVKEKKITGEKLRRIRKFRDIIANAIVSHHNTRGLKDYFNRKFKSPYLERVEKNNDALDLEAAKKYLFRSVIDESKFRTYFNEAFSEFEAIYEKVNEAVKSINDKNDNYKSVYLSFVADYIYSAMIDADRTDTALFENNLKKTLKVDSNKVYKNFESEIQKTVDGFEEGPLSKAQEEMRQDCITAANRKTGIYTLTEPAGGGKTLGSATLAVKHAQKFGEKRIIYVLPFQTIIDQTSNTFRKILNGNDHDSKNILELQSNVSNDLIDKNREIKNHLSLIEENIDYPIVITTMVQFLNAIYASGTSNRRRFHNLCNSVIIFDEIQKLPIKCTSLFNEAVNFLSTVGKSEIILCSATQPSLINSDYKIQKNSNSEIISNLPKRFEQFNRVEFVDKFTNSKHQFVEMSSYEAAKLIYSKYKPKQNVKQSVMAVFNTVKCTRDVFEDLTEIVRQKKDDVSIYYLSTRLCSAHRMDIINEIKKCLDPDNPKPVICVTTPLIEAGIDIDFNCVIRSLAGLDSILQAAGRCNRKGKLKDKGEVDLILMNSKEENLNKLVDIKLGQKIVKEMFKFGKHKASDLVKEETVRDYFDEYYEQNNTLNKTEYPVYTEDGDFNLSECVSGMIFAKESSDIGRIPLSIRMGDNLTLTAELETIADHFEVISNGAKSVLVPYKDGEKIIRQFKKDNAVINSKLIKDAQHYLVNVFDRDFDKLVENDGIEAVSVLVDGKEREVFCLKEDFYDDAMGLITRK